MNTKLLATLNVVIDALGAYINTMAKVDFIYILVKSMKRVLLCGLFLAVLLLSTWASILGLIFVYVSSIGFSDFQALWLILGINEVGIVVVLTWLYCIKRRFAALQRSGVRVVLTYIVKSINRLRNG